MRQYTEAVLFADFVRFSKRFKDALKSGGDLQAAYFLSDYISSNELHSIYHSHFLEVLELYYQGLGIQNEEERSFHTLKMRNMVLAVACG